MLLEYQKGGNLSQRINEGLLFSEDEARVITAQLLLSADFMNLKNVIHRDLKPDNILLNSKNQAIHDVRIADLGFAIYVKEESKNMIRCGTPAYCAPEIFVPTDHLVYTSKVDIYSIGCILFYILTGTHFFLA